MCKLMKYIQVMCVGMFMVSCSQPIKQRPAVNYKTLTISLSDMSVQSEYTATLQGTQYVEIRPQVSGVITEIRLNEGAKVKQNEVLFVIDQVPYKAALQTARANVKSAEARISTTKLNVKSSKELYKEDVVSEYDLQTTQNTQLEAEAYLAQAKAQELIASNNLSYTEVKSPVDGVTSMIPYRIGALVGSTISMPLVTVSDDELIHAYFSMNESQILELTRTNGSIEGVMASMPVINLKLSDGSMYEEIGTLDAISGTIEKGTGAVKLRAVFGNPNKVLRNGGSGSVVIPNIRTDVIVIPKVATYELQNKIFVYKVVDGKATSCEIKVSPLNHGRQHVVESGIEVGDVIIAEGAGLVREGAVVSSAGGDVNKNKAK